VILLTALAGEALAPQPVRESRFFVPPSDVRLKAVALTPTSEQQIGQMRA
jgi:hypothetical protein